MGILREKRALTLVEVVVSIAIFAAVALPLLTVFGQSVKTDKAASDVLNANYICQDYLEKLDTLTYPQALSGLPSASPKNGYYLTASIRPYGTANSLFSGQCAYVHLIMYEDSKMLAVMPDGKWNLYGSVPSTMSFGLSGVNYTFTGGGVTKTGTSPYGYCAVIINAMKKPSATTATVTLGGADCKAVVYCKENHTADITVTGSCEKFENIISGGTSLIYVSASVYVLASDTKPVSKTESYIKIKNW